MNTRKGFTLVELLVVIAILAILATVSVVGYTAFIAGADEQAVITEAEQVKTTIDAGLTYRNCVEIKCNNASVHVSLDANGAYTLTSATPCHNASTDCDVPGTVTVESGVLYYTSNGYKVNLSTLEATEVQ